MIVVARYTASTRVSELIINNISHSIICAPGQIDLVGVGTTTKVGQLFVGSIAGIYAVDASLDDVAVSRIVDSMHRGDDVLQPCTTLCRPGFYDDAGVCVACAKGTFKQYSGAQACTDCPARTTTLLEGNVLITGCVCEAGVHGPATGPCVPCPVGTYKNTSMSSCTACLYSLSSPAGSAHVTDCVCAPGFTGPDIGPCVLCETEKFKNEIGSADCACRPGFTGLGFIHNNGSCAVCGVDPNPRCPCPVNTFSTLKVLNPPENFRSYSSGGGGSLLDTIQFAQGLSSQNAFLNLGWYPIQNTNQWMEIDAGEAMLIAGIITQSGTQGTNHWMTSCRVQHRLEFLGTGLNVTQSGGQTSGAKVVIMFQFPVWARRRRARGTKPQCQKRKKMLK